MSEGPEWFAPKRFGLGSGLPIAWQGWAVLLVYLAVIGGAIWAWGEHALPTLSVLLTATAVLLVTAARTTRGGWR